MSTRLVIAVDGPAASGKGTLATRLAAHFNLPHLDTGLLYRAVGKKLLASAGTLSPLETMVKAIEAAKNLSAEDLTAEDLGQESVAKMASIASAIPEVRAALLQFQLDFAAAPQGAVLDGRDIGTVICPQAPYKFFVTARAEIRAERRFLQQKDAPDALTYETILAAIHERDQRDTARSSAPLVMAEDAFLIESSALTADEVFALALAQISHSA